MLSVGKVREISDMKKFFIALAFLVGVFVFSGCECRGIRPPLTVTFRESMLPGGTRVLQITNRSSSETLVLRVDAFNDARNQHAYQIVNVSPGAVQELGIIEMDWLFEKGERYKISADGYLLSVRGTVP